MFKFFITVEQADFRPLTQEPWIVSRGRGGSAGDSPLGRLLDLALTGAGTRSPRYRKLNPQQEWTTVQQAIVLEQ